MALTRDSENYSSLQRWIDRIVLDIASKALTPGDPYLTADEAGAFLGCSRATAHRAMKHLVEKGILAARRGSGTFIGPGVAAPPMPVAQCLHALMPLGFMPCNTGPLVRVLQAVARSLGGLGINFSNFPAGYDLHYVAETVLKPYRAGHTAAVLALGCHWTLHQYLREHGLKVLVIGSMFPDRQFLSSIDTDAAQAAGLLVDSLVARNHRRFAVLVLASGLAGVDLFTDAISRRLSSHGIPADSLALRFCNGDEPVTLDRLRELLNSPQRPTAIITDEEDLANLAFAAARSMNLSVPGDLEIVFEGSLVWTGTPSRYPHTRAVLSEKELEAEIAGMIRSLQPSPAEPKARIVPVSLVSGIMS